jgi:hypothetical protein
LDTKNISLSFVLQVLEEQLHLLILASFLSFPKMACSSQNNFDLNVVPNAQPKVWCPSFLSQKGPFTANDSMMLDDAAATTVAKGIITTQDEKLLADRFDVEAINDSMAFSIQGVYKWCRNNPLGVVS